MIRIIIRHAICEACINAFFDVIDHNRKPPKSRLIYTQPKNIGNNRYDPKKVSIVWSDGKNMIPIRGLRGYGSPIVNPSNECWY